MPAKTLLQFAGAPAASPPALAQSALVLIDIQQEYVSGDLALPGVDAAIQNAADLLDKARSAGATIIHVKHLGGETGLFETKGPRGEIVDPVAPRDGEQLVEKRLPNAFANTDLDAKLKAAGKPGLILAGFMTHMCVSATARSALDHGYYPTVVASACGTRDLPSATGGADVPASQVHETALAEINDRFALVVKDSAVF